MNPIAISLSFALLILTNSGYGQNIDTIESRYNESKVLVQSLSNEKLSDKQLLSSVRSLKKSLKMGGPKTAQGGVDSGGGTLVQIKQITGLLDLYLYNPKAFFSTTEGLPLPITRTYKDFGFEVLDNKSSTHIQQALMQVEKWRASSPFVTMFVAKALNEIPAFYIKSRLAFNDQMAFIPGNTNLPKDSIRLGAYYIRDLGVLIEKNSFDALSLNNQTALLVHEALRHQQMTFDSGMTNEDIQRLTAMLLSEPAPNLSLDHIPYGGTFMLKLLEDAENEIQFGSYSRIICKFIPDTCSWINDNYSTRGVNQSDLGLLVATNEMERYFYSLEFEKLSRKDQEKILAITNEARDFAIAKRKQEEPARILKTQYSNPSWNSFTKPLLADLSRAYNNRERYYSVRNLMLQDFTEKMRSQGLIID